MSAKTVISGQQKEILEEWYKKGMCRRAAETKDMRAKAASAAGLSLVVIDVSSLIIGYLSPL